MAIKLEILTENKEALRAFGEIRDAVVKTSNLLEQIAKDMGKFGKAGTTAAKETDRAFDQTDKSVKKLSKDIDSSSESFQKLTKYAAGFFTLQAAQGFARKIFEVRQEIESLQTSFRILVGDKDKADALFQGIKEFATSTPMQMKDLASAAQTMMGFGIPLEQIMENLKAIGDVSMGDAQRFQALALSFSQMSAAGKLMGQDLMQMINAGFNPLATMAEKTGKSIGTLKDEMSKGAISADMVRQAFIDATSEGGKFHGMLEEQSKTLKGAYSNLQGAIDDMLNSIGEKMQGTFTSAIDSATYLAKNYEEVGKVILTVVAAFGAYKAALMVIRALEVSRAVWGTATAFVGLAKSVTSAKDAMVLFNLATKASPIGIVLSVVAAAAAAFALFGKRTSEAEKMEKRFSESTAKATANVKALYATLGTANKTSKVAADTAKELKQVADEYGVKLSEEAKKLGNETKLVEELTNKREQLIDAIRREAIERERANQQKEIEDDYAAKIQEAREEFVKSLSDDFSSQSKGIMSQLITDEDLEKIGHVEAKIRQLSELYGKYSVEVAEAERERTAMTDALVKKLWDYSAELGRVEGKESKYAAAASNMKDAVVGFIRATNDNVVAQENAKIALARATLATAEQIKVQDAAKVSCDALSSITSSLITLWNSENHMTLKIHYDDSEIPQWMKGLTDDQLAKSIAARQNAIRGKKKVKYGNRTFDSDEQTATELGMLQSVQEGRKPKTTPTITSTTPTTKPKKTPKPHKSTWNQAHANADAKEMLDKWKEEMKELLADVNQDIADANVEYLDESTEKTLAKINEDEKKQLAAIDKQRKDLIEKRKELDISLWEKKGEKNNKYNYKELSEDEYLGMIKAEAPGLLDALDKRKTQVSESTKKQRDEIAKQEAASMREYLKQYGDYQQQRQAITEEYDEKIRKAQTEGEKLALGKQKEEELRQVDERFGVVTQAMADLFADASKKSVTAIQAIIDKYQKLVEYMEGHKGTADREGLAALGISEREIQKILSGDISIKELTDRLKELKGELKDRSPYQSFVGNMKAIVEQLKKAKNAADVGEGISALTDAVNDFLPAVKEFGSNIANIFGADDSKLNGVIDGIGGLATAGGGVGQIMSGDIVGGVMNTVKGISQMVDALDGLFGADYSSYENMVEQYDRLIDVWDTLIDRKQEYIDMSYGPEAAKAGQEAIDIIERQTEAYRNLGREWLNAGASAGSHSQGVRQRNKMSDADWQNVAKALGRSTDNYAGLGGRLEGLFELSASQLEDLQEQAPEFWAKLNDETQKYLQGIIDGEQKIEDIQKQVNEQLTSTTFDSLKDSFASVLYDMESTAEEGGENIGEALFKSIVDNFILGDEFDKWLQGFYEKWAEKIGSGTMTRQDWDEYNAEYQRELASRMAQRDAWAQAVGYTGKQGDAEGSATYNAVKSFTQEQGDVLNGRLTAIQIGVREGNLLRQQIANSLDAMKALTEGSGAAIDDMRDLIAVSNTHLADIVSLNKKMLTDFGEKIDKIVLNTNNL